MRGDQEAGRHAPDCGVDRQAPRLSADDSLKVGHLTSNAKAPLDVSHQQSSARGHGDPTPMHSVNVLYRFRYTIAGGHVHVRMFAGKGVGSLGKCGALVFRDHEWDHFRAGIERTIGTDRGIGHDVEFIDETPSDAPFLAVGNDELGAAINGHALEAAS